MKWKIKNLVHFSIEGFNFVGNSKIITIKQPLDLQLQISDCFITSKNIFINRTKINKYIISNLE